MCADENRSLTFSVVDVLMRFSANTPELYVLILHQKLLTHTIEILWDRLGMRRFVLYTAAQLLGAMVGAFMLRCSLPPGFLATPFTTDGSLTAAHPVQVFILEFLATFVLVYVVFATAVDRAGAAKVLCVCLSGNLRLTSLVVLSVPCVALFATPVVWQLSLHSSARGTCRH